jgi:hypothetical protein
MYVIDLTHYLDEKGAIAPRIGPARKIANFLTAVVAHASDPERPEETPGPLCFKCRKRNQSAVATGINTGKQIIWYCPTCGTGSCPIAWCHQPAPDDPKRPTSPTVGANVGAKTQTGARKDNGSAPCES